MGNFCGNKRTLIKRKKQRNVSQNKKEESKNGRRELRLKKERISGKKLKTRACHKRRKIDEKKEEVKIEVVKKGNRKVKNVSSLVDQKVSLSNGTP